ncbi:hypothetical protein L1D34_21880 [Vibrio mediterranei]|uniref:hypothetical protein n=1 Tax=Vibrio mediterranei TaxID=689 RepID=UPI001EFDD70A|nr:hypothetical protein [Vibrio mediterranei]MCG9627487.1 hypothetical protein [Vibrio mediterranei]MCG9657668.1 hypothetical protein [Vibrio mediterranei]
MIMKRDSKRLFFVSQVLHHYEHCLILAFLLLRFFLLRLGSSICGAGQLGSHRDNGSDGGTISS